MNAKKIQELGVEIENLIQQERLIKERERFDTLVSLYNDFITTRNTGHAVYLNKDLLALAITSYFDDIYRFKKYTHSERADQHKQAAYLIKWISKIRPIQISPNTVVNRRILLINSSFAIFVGFSFLSLKAANSITPKYYKHLLYMCQYRNISGRQLASTLYVLEKQAEGERP
jgi:hypothetical protein